MASGLLSALKQEFANTVNDFKSKGAVIVVTDAAFDVAEIVQHTFSDTVQEIQQHGALDLVRETAADVGEFVQQGITDTVSEFYEKGPLGVAEDAVLDVGDIVGDAGSLMLNASDRIVSVARSSSTLNESSHMIAKPPETVYATSISTSRASGNTPDQPMLRPAVRPCMDDMPTPTCFRQRCYQIPEASWRRWFRDTWKGLQWPSTQNVDSHNSRYQWAAGSLDSDADANVQHSSGVVLKLFAKAASIVQRCASFLAGHVETRQSQNHIKIWHMVSAACVFDVFVPFVGLAHWAPLNTVLATAGVVWAFHWICGTSINSRTARLSF